MKEKLLIGLLLIFSVGYAAAIPVNSVGYQDTQIDPPDDVNILILVASGVGITYYHAKEKFELWGWDVVTAGVSASVVSCPRQNPQVIDADILISDISWLRIMEFDAIFVPSGGHWDALSSFQPTLDLIYRAYYSGLIISSLCVGIVVLARADIINGIKIARETNFQTFLEEAGGIIIEQSVVSDKRIVTGGTGGGPYGGGASVAPTNETCEAIASAINTFNNNFVISTVIASGFIIGSVIFLTLPKYLKKRRRN